MTVDYLVTVTMKHTYRVTVDPDTAVKAAEYRDNGETRGEAIAARALALALGWDPDKLGDLIEPHSYERVETIAGVELVDWEAAPEP